MPLEKVRLRGVVMNIDHFLINSSSTHSALRYDEVSGLQCFTICHCIVVEHGRGLMLVKLLCALTKPPSSQSGVNPPRRDKTF
jgi:hypothetical protein